MHMQQPHAEGLKDGFFFCLETKSDTMLVAEIYGRAHQLYMQMRKGFLIRIVPHTTKNDRSRQNLVVATPWTRPRVRV
jgi:hypothetical protein